MADRGEQVVVLVYPEEVNRMARSIEKTLSLSDPEPTPKPEPSRTIVRVRHPTLRQHGDLDPEFITLGPLHRSQKPALQRLDVKATYLQSLLRRSNATIKLDDLVSQVNGLEWAAREHYPPEELSELGKDEFVEMVVVDGCFAVEYLVRRWLGEAQEEVVDRYELLLKKDLLRLENQLPFCVLDSIFRSAFGSNKFCLATVALSVLAGGGKLEVGEHQSVHHLLHLLHLSTDNFCDETMRKCLPWWVLYACSKCFSSLSYGCVCCFGSGTQSNDYEKSKPPGGVPNAAYLRDHGFKFVSNSEASSFLDVRIRGATIKIPALHIGNYSLSLLRNLLTLEKCCAVSGKHVTRYGTFMCNLIRTKEDVEILQEGGIIGKFPGSSEKVLGFFGSVCRGERLDRDAHHLTGEVEKIDRYFRKRYHKVQLYKWRKKLIPDYFSNPWAVPSMVAAFILLLLTVVQTFFAVYSYYRPPS